jgi:RHS repeat-associated protein
LSTASEGSTTWSRTFGYDQYGNMWLASWSPSTLIDPTTPASQSWINAANNRLTNTSLGIVYDSGVPSGPGNLTSINGATYAYDAENRLLTSTIGGVTTAYTYDGDGRRVQKATGTSTTVYVYDAQGQLAAEYATLPTAQPCATCYLTADRLGSTRMVTDANARVQSLTDYLPFGEEIPAPLGARAAPYYPTSTLALPDGVTQKFTGKERDQETGLDYFGARYLSAAQGRFTSPDPLGILRQKMTDPQQWNMYSYTRNNPLRLLDPTGLYVTSCQEKDVSKCDANTQAIEAARQRDLQSKEKSIRNAAKAYGDYGTPGVTVTFGAQAPGGGGKVTFDLDSSGKATGTITVNITSGELAEASGGKVGEAVLDAIVAHEGAHVKDYEKLIEKNYGLKYDISHRRTEEHAYSVENAVIEREVGRTNPDWQSKKAIDNYIKEHPALYPAPDAPILNPAAIPK